MIISVVLTTNFLREGGPMKREMAGTLLALLIAGCSSPEPPTRAVATAPEPGDKVIIGDPGRCDLWDDLKAMREARSFYAPHEPDVHRSDEFKAIDAHRFGLVSPGDLVEVLEVGDDFAKVLVLGDRSGELAGRRGYTRAWWKP
jgi:hypothetical protein